MSDPAAIFHTTRHRGVSLEPLRQVSLSLPGSKWAYSLFGVKSNSAVRFIQPGDKLPGLHAPIPGYTGSKPVCIRPLALINDLQFMMPQLPESRP